MSVIVRRTPDSAAFFDAANEGVLLLRRCRTCDAVRSPLDAACPACQTVDAAWIRAAGGATLVTWSDVHRSTLPQLKAPYVVGIVELMEGPWILVRLIGVDPDELTAGMAMRLTTLTALDEGEPLMAATRSEEGR